MSAAKELFQLGLYQKALDSYNCTLTLVSDEYVWNGKGNVLCRLDSWEEAIQAYKNALRLES